MNCRSTPSQARRSGMTLVEILVAVGIGSLMMVVVVNLTMFSGRSLAALANYTDLHLKSRVTLDRMTMEIRQANGVAAFSSNYLNLQDADGSVLQFIYNPNHRTLTRIKNGVSEVMLTECDSFRFSGFQRTTIAGSYNQTPTTDPAVCKRIQISWVCSRSMLGLRLNTECIQSGTVVIRKQ